MQQFTGVLGIAAIIAVCWFFSADRKLIPWRTVWVGLALQIVFAVAILGVPRWHVPGVFRVVFQAMNDLVDALVSFSDAGADFVFGTLGKNDAPMGFIFAFRALPPIIFFSSLVAVLYHLGVLQKVVGVIAKVMAKTMSCSGAESLSNAANIFMGQTEAPLLVKPYMPDMTRSELFCIMVGGMATIAAGVMGAYVGLLKARVPDIAGHLLTASVMAAPATVIISKMLVPEKGKPLTMGTMPGTGEKIDSNFIEAAARGASEGVALAINVAAMLIAFIALTALVDGGLSWIGGVFHFGQTAGGEPLSLAWLTGKLFAPVSWLMGIPWSESAVVGRLLGEKVILNEFVAYVHLAGQNAQLSDRTVIITSYALCGFANFSSIGIQVGGLGVMAPNQRGEVARLGFLCVVAGSLATFMIAAIAGMLY